MDTHSVTIQGYAFSVPVKYTEGHVCSAAEAKALNQLLAENIGNNWRAKIKEAGELTEAQHADFASKVFSAAEAYDFAIRTASPRQVRDPVEKEALRLAKADMEAQLSQQGSSIRVLTANLASKLLASGTLTVAEDEKAEDAAKREAKSRVDAKIAELATDEARLKIARRNVAKAKEATVGSLEDLLAV